jgi:hypothetical protein
MSRRCVEGLDPAKFPRVHDHRRRMDERPAAKRALEQETA